MHFLICIGGKKYSRDTVGLGIRLAEALKADVSILMVRERVSSRFKKEIQLAADKIQEWKIETREVRVLKRLQELLMGAGYLRTVEGGKADVRHPPRGVRGAYEYHLYGARGEDVRIRVREGDTVGNIIRETQEVDYDLVVIGSPRDGGRLVRQIIQYIDTSVLIVQQPQDIEYRLLLCLDHADLSMKALDFTVRAARLLQTSVDLLFIYHYPWEEHQAMSAAEKARRLLRRFHIDHDIHLRRGPVVRSILKESASDHIVILGTSGRSSLWQFFFGSTPVRIARMGQGPVLVIK